MKNTLYAKKPESWEQLTTTQRKEYEEKKIRRTTELNRERFRRKTIIYVVLDDEKGNKNENKWNNEYI